MTHRNGSSSSSMTEDRLDEITATHVTVDRSAVRNLNADLAQLEKAAVGRLRAGEANVNQGTVGIAAFETGTLRQSAAGVVVAKSVACDEVRTAVLVSPVVRGDVHTWLDLRTAFAIGLGIALGRALLAGARALGRRAAR
ncbi:MAG: hypothetical protein IT303_12805 [Dehalococcoidia bacterium]|nr:hypothetical protein [Dehalococcoidia bacterium]